jgi:hypothetical protein
MRKPELPIEFTELPERDQAYVYTITDSPSALPGYGRLLPLINYYRVHAQYRVLGDPSAGIVIEGPTTIAEIEERFLLPKNLNFWRRNKFEVTLDDDELHVTFRPKKSIWLTVGSHEFYDGRDSLTGNHTRHVN